MPNNPEQPGPPANLWQERKGQLRLWHSTDPLQKNYWRVCIPTPLQMWWPHTVFKTGCSIHSWITKRTFSVKLVLNILDHQRLNWYTWVNWLIHSLVSISHFLVGKLKALKQVEMENENRNREQKRPYSPVWCWSHKILCTCADHTTKVYFCNADSNFPSTNSSFCVTTNTACMYVCLTQFSASCA